MLSVIILTKNEEKNIIDAIESVSFADEIIIVDDFSDDHTKEAAESLRNTKVKIFKRKLDNFAAQRNYALKKAKEDWIFFLDADERVSPGLRGEIEQLMKDGSRKKGFFVKRTDVMLGKELKYGETSKVRLLRLAKRGSGMWHGKVHEKWEIKRDTGHLNFSLYHYPHPTIREFISEINKYTQIRAEELFKIKEPVSLLQIVTYPVGKFVQNYFFRQGYRDGTHGFVFAMMMSFHSFLVRSKLWLLWEKK